MICLQPIQWFVLAVLTTAFFVSPAAATERSASPAEEVVADPHAAQVAELIDTVVRLPGHDIRLAYLGQVLDTAPRDLATRVKAALELVDLLRNTATTDDRLRRLLTAALALDQSTREAALVAASTGDPAPEVRGPTPPTEKEPVIPTTGPDLLADLAVGVGDVAWGSSALEVQQQLGDEATPTAARDWTGPTYPEDLAVLVVGQDLNGCAGELAHLLSVGGFWRAWFTTADTACWDRLGALLEDRLGAVDERRRHTPAGVMLVREWEEPARVTLGTALVQGEPVGDIYLHLQPPVGLLDSPTAQGESHRGGDSSGERKLTQYEKGELLKRKAGPHLGVGFSLIAVAVGTGLGTIALLRSTEAFSFEGTIALAMTSLGTGAVGTVFVIVGGAMDTAGNIYLGRRGRRPGVELRLAVGPTSVGLGLRF